MKRDRICETHRRCENVGETLRETGRLEPDPDQTTRSKEGRSPICDGVLLEFKESYSPGPTRLSNPPFPSSL